MGQRSRKRRETGEAARPKVTARPEAGAAAGEEAAKPDDAMRRGYARGRERDEQLRAQLAPLKPGERPGAVTVGAIVAALFGLGNVVLWAIGVEVNGERPQAGGTLVFAALMVLAAWGMWQAKYWAVIGFQALLALVLVVATLAIFVADSVLEALALGAIIAFGGWLFWKLIRAMARLQMPTRG